MTELLELMVTRGAGGLDVDAAAGLDGDVAAVVVVSGALWYWW